MPEWEHLTALLDHEVQTSTDGMALRTYMEMKRVLADGIGCTSCDSTGRGANCPKCKGTGRRAGGRCRADGCYRGAATCATCRGRGYLTAESKLLEEATS